jgi:putative endonuclease
VTSGTASARLGRSGEELAARFLEKAGYRVLARNWRAGHSEVDIVALHGGTVAFVEVKTRRPGPERPIESLTPRQRRTLRRAAEAWIHAHPGIGNEFRFDLIAVEVAEGRPPRVEHLANAFYGEEAL